MVQYRVDYTYSIPVWGSDIVSADTPEDAELTILNELKSEDDLDQIEITGVQEIDGVA